MKSRFQRIFDTVMVFVVLVTVPLALMGVVNATQDTRDRLTIELKVTSAEHELQEGYFALGDGTTVTVKPGTDLFQFLSRMNGKTISLTAVEVTGEPRKLEQIIR